MLEYRGQYRVLYELDSKGTSTEFVYIPCNIKKGANICRHNVDTLNVFIPSVKIAKRLLREYSSTFNLLQMGDSEATLLFDESDIITVAHILKARVLGKNKSPKPKRKINFSDEQKEALSKRMTELRQRTKTLEKNRV